MQESPSFKRELLATLPSLRAFAVSLSGRHDRADDLVQDTMMKAWAKQDSYQMGTNIKAWLFTILRNEFYSQMRKRGREVQDTDGAFTERMSVHPSQYGVLDMADFKKALDTLPPDQREAVVLIGASGFSYEEAAEICHCAVGTMKSRVSRARTRLQDILKISGEAYYGPDAVSALVTTQTVSCRGPAASWPVRRRRPVPRRRTACRGTRHRPADGRRAVR
jgi:RNA polymerase sigma-70 factor (ECF subfamily)